MNILYGICLPFEVAKCQALWGTYGQGGIEHCGGGCPDHPLKFVRLIDCTTEHLQTILDNQKSIPRSYRQIIQAILEERTDIPLT